MHLGIVVLAILFLIIDASWLSLIMGPMFNDMVHRIQGQDINLRYSAAAVSYAALIAGCYGATRATQDSLQTHSIYMRALPAGVFGLLSYAIFDFTNLAVFDAYDPKLALIDTLWGGVVCYFSTLGMLAVQS